ncbi:hypothetical protein [Sulfurospirillum sp.]|jgi:hypothetical protein|uniref:hypothetical protein n=1 Tax=Sulfurospirillum sp. TaxID=2053622 RepID=UPI002FDF012D
MDALNSSIPSSTEIYAMKQAMKVQEQMVSKLLESMPQPTDTASTQVSGLASEGIGSNLDLKA